jgi:uncharacterized membrane protein
MALAWPPVTEAGDGVVRAVLFISPTCPHCHKVREEVLPPLSNRFEGRFQVAIVSTATPTGRDLYWAAFRRYGVQQRGVPLLVVGDFALVGSDEIPRRLPGLISAYLTEGGASWPDIPGLPDVLAASTVPPPAAPGPADDAREAAGPAPVPPGATAERAAPGAAPLPLAAPQPPPAPLPTATPLPKPSPPPPPHPQPAAAPVTAPAPPAGAEQPSAPVPAGTSSGPRPPSKAPSPLRGASASAPPATVPTAPAATASVTAAPAPGLILVDDASPEPAGVLDRVRTDPRGNGLAIVVLAAMAAAVLRSLVVLRRPPPPARGRPLDGLTPLLALAGLGVAAYLAHVEVRDIEAVCGPVGDCNTVQQSEYARLFGVLPIGVLGLLGFAAILVAWGVRRFGAGRASSWAAIALLAMTGLGTLFSIYLTFLEPFVIGATCLWCLSSAVIMTALHGLAHAPGRAAAAELRLYPSSGFERQAG